MNSVALSGTCQMEDCAAPPMALVVVDFDQVEDGVVIDVFTDLVAMCRDHAIEELEAQ